MSQPSQTLQQKLMERRQQVSAVCGVCYISDHLPFLVHNLCWERPISILKESFSSSLVVLQYGVLRSVLFSGPGCSFSGEKRGLGVFYNQASYLRASNFLFSIEINIIVCFYNYT